MIIEDLLSLSLIRAYTWYSLGKKKKKEKQYALMSFIKIEIPELNT